MPTRSTPELCRSAGVACVVAVDDAEPFADLPVRPLGLEEAAAGSVGPPDVAALDQDLAYILFTSGSTGNPKGVMLSHLHALTFVNWAVDTFALCADDRLSNHAPFNFDLSVLDLYGAPASGACSLIPEGLVMSPAGSPTSSSAMASPSGTRLPPC